MVRCRLRLGMDMVADIQQTDEANEDIRLKITQIRDVVRLQAKAMVLRMVIHLRRTSALQLGA